MVIDQFPQAEPGYIGTANGAGASAIELLKIADVLVNGDGLSDIVHFNDDMVTAINLYCHRFSLVRFSTFYAMRRRWGLHPMTRVGRIAQGS